MLESFYTLALLKRNKLLKQFDNFSDKDFNINDFWNEFNIPANKNKFTIAAGDGSINHIKFLKYDFYAVAALSLIYSDKIEKLDCVDLDILEFHPFFEDRLRNFMNTFEIKNAISTFSQYDIDYYLYDGSIFGDLIRPIPFERDIPSDIRNEINNNILNLSDNSLKNNDISEVIFNKVSSIEVEDYKIKVYIENVLSLNYLSILLKNKNKLVSISKTSHSSDAIGGKIPDMAFFEDLTYKEGCSDIIYKDLSNESKFSFPIHNDLFKSLEFTIFYARLQDNKNILKFELPFKADEKYIQELLTILKRDSVEGYPYLLKKAHNEVVIKNKDIDSLSKIIGFYEKSGREMLN